jgi:hypothetical protein
VSSIHNLRIHHVVVERGFVDHLKDLNIDGRIIMKWTGMIYLQIGTSGRQSCTH